MSLFSLRLFIVALFVFGAQQSFSQAADFDTTFHLNRNNHLYSTLNDDFLTRSLHVLPDSSFVGFGGFRPCYRVDKHGVLDASFFNPEAYNQTYGSYRDAEGRFVIWGSVTISTYGEKHGIARLLSNGRVDSTFAPINSIGSMSSSVIWSACPLPDNSIIAAGIFGAVNGVPHSNIVKINPEGVVDFSFAANGSNARIRAVALDTISDPTNPTLLVGGEFTMFNGVDAPYLVRINLDGSLVSSFHSTLSVNGEVSRIQIDSQGRVYIAGPFTMVNGVNTNRITRIFADGTLDEEFNTNAVAFGILDGPVHAILIEEDRLLLGGEFTTIGTTPAVKVLSVFLDGQLNPNFDLTQGGPGGSVYSLARWTDSTYVVGGSFTRITTSLRKDIYVIDLENHLVRDKLLVEKGFSGLVKAVLPLPNGNILYGGDFVRFDGTTCNGLACTNAAGEIVESFINNLPNGSSVSDFELRNDTILVSGSFTSYRGQPVRQIMKIDLDGNLDPNFNTTTGPNNQVFDCAIAEDGTIFCVGSFSNVSGLPYNKVVRLNPNGTVNTNFDLSFEIGFGEEIRQVVVDNQRVYLSGNIWDRPQNLERSGIYVFLWDGQPDFDYLENLPSGNTTFSNSRALALDNQGRLLISVGSNDVLRLNVNGSLQSELANVGGSNVVQRIRISENDKIYLAGQFTSVGGISEVQRLARLFDNGSIDTGFTPVPFNSDVWDVAEQPWDDKVIAVGNFSSFGDQQAQRLARLRGGCTSVDVLADITNVTQNAPLCVDSLVTLTVQGTSLFGSYIWSIPPTWTLVADNGNSISVVPSGDEGAIMVYLENECGTSDVFQTNLQPIEINLVDVSIALSEQNPCIGESVVVSTDVNTINGNAQYIWHTSQAMQTSGSGTYTFSEVGADNYVFLQVNALSGCNSPSSFLTDTLFFFGEEAPPVPSLNFLSNGTFTTNASLDLTIEWFVDGVLLPEFTNQTTITPVVVGLYRVVVTTSFGCSTPSSAFFFSGISVEETEADFQIYPNPAVGSFQVNSLQAIRSMELYDSIGHLVYTGNSAAVDTHQFPVGVYFLRIHFQSGEVGMGRVAIH
jgi:uncharacterized delta-60 repeat protein